jgi:hypothetical protein
VVRLSDFRTGPRARQPSRGEAQVIFPDWPLHEASGTSHAPVLLKIALGLALSIAVAGVADARTALDSDNQADGAISCSVSSQAGRSTNPW